MWIGGARSPRSSSALLYAALAPRLGLGGRADLAPGRARDRRSSCSSTPTYAGLFHEVSSDPVFAFLLAWWAGAVVRAWSTGRPAWLVAVGVGVALLTLCRPAAQVALLAVRARPARRPPRLDGRRSRGIAVCLVAAVDPARGMGRPQRGPVRRPHRRAREQGVGAVLPGRRATSIRRTATRRGVSPTPSSSEVLHAAAVREPRRRRRGRTSDGVGNLEVIRMIALSDSVFGWDDDYDVLFDASLEAIRADPGRYARGVADTFWDFLSQRYAPEPRARPVADPGAAGRARGRRRAVPRADHRLAARPGDPLRLRLVPDRRPRALRRPRSGRGARRRESQGEALHRARRHDPRLERAAADARLERLARDRRAAPRATAGRARSSGSRSRRVALAIRRPRGSAPSSCSAAVAALVLLVHALSQAPQSEFELPFVPVWIVAALVGLLAPEADDSVTRLDDGTTRSTRIDVDPGQRLRR